MMSAAADTAEIPSRPAAIPRTVHAVWAVAGCWLIAVAAIWFCGANTAAILRIGMAQEAAARAAQPDTTPGKGRSAALAADAPPPMMDADSFCWINLTEAQVAAGAWRNRQQHSDGLPAGRESHWSASFAWWLLALAAPLHFFGATPWPHAIADVAAAANPILLAIVLALLARWLWRRAGPWSAGVAVITLATLWGVEWDFGYGRPDHHGLHLVAFLGMLINALGAGLGWVCDDPADEGQTGLVRPRRWCEARRSFAWSGAFGAAGLWIGATQQMFVIGTVGAAACLGALLFVRRSPGSDSAEASARFDPSLWRLWARVGAVVSVGFYLLEYFPADFRMRLEVNHPFYALAWLGGGELIYAAGVWAQTRGWPGRNWWLRVALGIGLLAVLPVAVLAGPRDWYVLRDPQLHRLMRLVVEGQPFVGQWTLSALTHAFVQIGSLWFALPVALLLVVGQRRWRIPPWQAMGVFIALAVAAVCCAWLLVQTRWLGFVGAALTALALVLAPGTRAAAPANVAASPRSTWPFGLLALTVPGWLLFALQQSLVNPQLQAQRTFRWVPVSAEIAWNLRLDQGGNPNPPHVIAPITASTALRYYGGAVTMGSLYWENMPACRRQAQFMDDDQPGEPVARRMARECALDYVLVTADPEAVLQAQWLDRGVVDRATIGHTLIFRLSNPLRPQPPDWLEPVPLLDAPLAAAAGARLYRVRRDRL